MSGCVGSCCINFTLPYSLEEIKSKALAGEEANGSKEEFPKLAEMLTQVNMPGHKPYLYNCNHFLMETKRCGNYENRPRLCASYPNDVSCSIQGCTEPVGCNPIPKR